MHRFFFVPLILCFVFLLFLCHAQDTNFKSKSSLVNGILQKVLNLSISSFANTPIEEREKMMVKIEGKLNKSSQFLGPKSEKYVGLIMKGVKAIASGKTALKSNDDVETDSSSEEIDYDEMYEEQVQKGSTKFLTTNTKKTANKNAGESFKQTKHPEEQQDDVSNIQKKVIKSAIKKPNIINNNQEAGLLNRDYNVAQKNIKITKEVTINPEDNEARRMEFEFINNINVQKDDDGHNTRTKSNEILGTSDRGGAGNKIEPYFFNVTLKLPCKDKTIITCAQIKALRTIQCITKTISVEKLCDGVDDCFDYSDEQDCAIKGVNLVRNASQLMSDIEQSLSKKCISGSIDDSLIRKQNEVLRNVLQTELKFIQKHATVVIANSTQSYLRKLYTEPDNIKKTVNEVAGVITTLSFALERTLCSDAIEDTRKLNDLEDEIIRDEQDEFEHELVKTNTWSPNSCQCIEEFCVGQCSEDCESVCSQKYQIGRWHCLAVSNEKSVSLDLVCDGKLDCYDEADESSCHTVSGLAKFEANDLYNKVLDMIKTKTKVISSKEVRHSLINLQMLVEKLQQLTTRREPDVVEVKALRDQCFSTMVVIYDQTGQNQVSMAVMDDFYLFLMILNDKLVNAMKRSHIGNDRLISPDGCFCRDNKCALLKCSKACIRACPTEPKLTRYFCGGSTAMNESIPIEAICNGRNDCPGQDDEKNCSEEICRNHHLVVLRHNINEFSGRNKDTSIGEALKAWKTKVSATLMVLESNERLTHQILRDVANDMLHDLVMSYATLTSSRRDNDQVISQFYKMALIVMQSLKSCAK